MVLCEQYQLKTAVFEKISRLLKTLRFQQFLKKNNIRGHFLEKWRKIALGDEGIFRPPPPK
jgi:hypothetical protein